MNGLAFLAVVAVGQLGPIPTAADSMDRLVGWKLNNGRLFAVIHIPKAHLADMTQVNPVTNRTSELLIDEFSPELAAHVQGIVIRIADEPAERIPAYEELMNILGRNRNAISSLENRGLGGFAKIDNSSGAGGFQNIKPPADLLAQNSLASDRRERDGVLNPQRDPASLETNQLRTPDPKLLDRAISERDRRDREVGSLLSDRITGNAPPAMNNAGSSPRSGTPNWNVPNQPSTAANTPPTGSGFDFSGSLRSGAPNGGGLGANAGTAGQASSGFATSQGGFAGQTNSPSMIGGNPTNYTSAPANNNSGYSPPATWTNVPSAVPNTHAQGPMVPTGSGGGARGSVAGDMGAPGPMPGTMQGNAGPSTRIASNHGLNRVGLDGMGTQPTNDPFIQDQQPRQTDQKFLLILFLFSLVGNIYLWIWLARLRDKYRGMVARERAFNT
jgi:hypothetical protein